MAPHHAVASIACTGRLRLTEQPVSSPTLWAGETMLYATSCRNFAKYAAAFFTIYRSSLALVSSRRKRAFSASSSVVGRLVGAVPSSAFSLPARARLTQLDKLDSGIPSRLAA